MRLAIMSAIGLAFDQRLILRSWPNIMRYPNSAFTPDVIALGAGWLRESNKH